MTARSKVLASATGLAAAAGAVGAARLHSFTRQLPFTTGEDERLTAATADGWNIDLHRYRPPAGVGRRPHPVVLGHGFAGSQLIWDLTPETSLARHLAASGYDTYTVDLRGRGASWPDGRPDRSLQWSFDDFVFHDLPTAVAAACVRSGAEQAFWVGLEMSGLAVYAAALSGTADRVRGAVTLGSPVLTPPTAHVPGVNSAPLMRLGGRVLFTAGSRLAGPILAMTGSNQLESSFRARNADPVAVARYLTRGIPDESVVLADQFKDWLDHGVMRNLDGTTTWSDQLHDITMPVLVMAAAHDLQRPADAIRATFDALGSPDKRWVLAGTATGFSVDFGHDDLVAGRASAAEVFPLITSWLDAHCEEEP